MARGRLGHELLAGAIAGGAIACCEAAGPLVAILAETTAAMAVAGVAAHAVKVSARRQGTSSAGLARRAARDVARRNDAPLAAHALDVLHRARNADARALRSVAMLLGRAASARSRGFALQRLASRWSPLSALAQLTSPFGVALRALGGAEFVREMVNATRPRCEPVPATLERETAWPYVARLSPDDTRLPREDTRFGDDLEAAPQGPQAQNWEVAA